VGGSRTLIWIWNWEWNWNWNPPAVDIRSVPSFPTDPGWSFPKPLPAQQ
jgi:hypothetical protein